LTWNAVTWAGFFRPARVAAAANMNANRTLRRGVRAIDVIGTDAAGAGTDGVCVEVALAAPADRQGLPVFRHRDMPVAQHPELNSRW
jgi:hypothetical protein